MARSLTDQEYRMAYTATLSPKQGIAEQEREFYVPVTEEVRGADLCQRLLDVVDLTLGDAVTLVTGPRGSGKTSELLRFGQTLKINRKFLYTDITDYLRPSEPLDPARLLTGIVAGLVSGIAKAGRDYLDIDTRSPWNRLRRFVKRLDVTGVDASFELGAEPVKATSTVHIALNDSPTFRDALGKAMSQNRANFREEMLGIVKSLTDKLAETGRTPVLVVDSLDHFRGNSDQNSTNSYERVRTSLETVFADFREELSLPGVHVLYSVPSYLQCSWANTRQLLNIKVLTQSGDPFEPGLAQLQAILEKRAPKDGGLARLLDGERLQRVLINSGGMFRDLFRLASEVVYNASSLPASDQAVYDAMTNCRRDILGGPTGTAREQMDLLAAIADNPDYLPRRDELSDFEWLETLGAIVRYPDGPKGYWLSVHPLLRDVVADSRKYAQPTP